MSDSRRAKRLLPWFGILAVALAVFLSVKALYGAGSSPTVIFVIMDTLRADCDVGIAEP